MKRASLLAVYVVASIGAQPPVQHNGKNLPAQFSAYIDTYWAASALRPASSDRQFLTQAARDREFNINLAHVAGALEQEKIRGRLALQFGTSVNANYQHELTTEKYSNQFSHRNLQEAFAGYRLLPKLWLDAGIFFGHIGVENWISHKNWNYTRALMADNTPYYSTGAKLSYAATPNLELQFLVLNGWQVITPTNRDPALGSKLVWILHPQWKLSHASFAGNAAPTAATTEYRFYSNLILEYSPLKVLQFALSADAAVQKNPTGESYRHWYTGALHVCYVFAQHWNVALRWDYFLDKEQVLIQTGSENGFQVVSSTVTINFQPEELLLLRGEYRNFFSKDSIYRFSDRVSAQEHLFVFAMSLLFTNH
ncbi:MAG: porin [Turneriella sp.]|nr:porin [Turneriella sp.]